MHPTNKTVLITGASTGIGKALAEEFAKHGHRLLLIARNQERLKEVKEYLSSIYHIKVDYLSVDLLKEDTPNQIFKYVQENQIDVEYLINNAGMGDACQFKQSDLKLNDNIIKLNVLALMHMNRLFLPEMTERKSGTIVNIASTLAFAPTAGQAVYAASKAFVLSFSQALYEEVKDTGVSVLTICPGVTATDFFNSAGFELVQFKAATPESFAEFAYQSIMKKKVVSIHKLSNRIIAVFTRLASRKIVRKAFASSCKTK